jgi:hypothetical protein
MLTITITPRATLLTALLAFGVISAFFATEASGTGDAPSEVVQGDINCDNVVDAEDALGALRHTAGLPVDQNDPCFAPGDVAAIPGPPGITQFAHVSSGAEVEAGTATDAELSTTGLYYVTFPVQVTSCVAVANPGPFGDGSYRPRASAVVSIPSSVSNTISVEFYVPDGSTADTDFHVILVC